MEAVFLSLLNTECTYSNITARDVYGNRTAGTTVTFKCYLHLDRIESYDAEGSSVNRTGKAVMNGVYDVQKGAILTLPDGSTPKITKVTTFYDENGTHHTTIEFEG